MERKILEIHPVAGALVARKVDFPRGWDVLKAYGKDFTHQSGSGGAEGIAGVGLIHQQAGARVLFHVLGVHGHRADEKKRASDLIEGVGHHRSEWPPWTLPRKSRKRSYAMEMQQGARALGIGWLGRR